MVQPFTLKQFASPRRLRFKLGKSPDGAPEEYVLSSDEKKRYAYKQTWDATKPHVLWVMLNPGTGEIEKRKRPTLGRCKKWSEEWGYGGLFIGNILATRAKSGKLLLQQADVNDEHNEAALRFLKEHAARTVVAWGNKWRHQQQVQRLKRIFDGSDCFGLTKKGEPRHPLHVRKDTALSRWVLGGRAASSGVYAR
jgi:hypothetical protein